MKLAFGLILLILLSIQQLTQPHIELTSIAFLLGVLCLFIVKERFLNGVWSSIAFLVFLLLLSYYQSEYYMLVGIFIVDMMYARRYLLGSAVSILLLAISLADGIYLNGFIITLSALFGYVIGEKAWNEKQYMAVFDDERRLRYRLEAARNELIHSRKEIEYLTRMKERNRIAHEIHDNIGHSIAGVKFQIEGARRIVHKDIGKLEEILALCSTKLSEALTLTRRTVHNINTDRKIGIDILENLAGDFKFCPIHFEYSGSFDAVSATNLEILRKMMMESLTNASKHSKAQHIHIRIEVRSKYLRFYYKDDGIGCSDIREGLGISGMRERVLGTGGTIAMDGKDGFMMVCHLPIIADKGWEESP